MTSWRELNRKPIKETEYFSDEEIAEIKERFPKNDRAQALIARLEAAEKSRQAWCDLFHALQEKTLFTNRSAYEADRAWRKAAGK